MTTAEMSSSGLPAVSSAPSSPAILDPITPHCCNKELARNGEPASELILRLAMLRAAARSMGPKAQGGMGTKVGEMTGWPLRSPDSAHDTLPNEAAAACSSPFLRWRRIGAEQTLGRMPGPLPSLHLNRVARCLRCFSEAGGWSKGSME